MEEETGR